MSKVPGERLRMAVALVQGVYYLLTGLWSLFAIESFQAVTGPKQDLWLVRTVGTLVIVMAASLLTAAARRRFEAPVIVLGAGAALAFIAVDVTFVALGSIAPIYLADAAAEVLILVGWLLPFKKSKEPEPRI
jgi:hypothetical protein